MGIHLHEHLIHLRGDLVKEGRENSLLRTGLNFIAWAWTTPWAYRFLSHAAYWGLKPLAKKRADGTEYVDNLPSLGAAWTDSRTFPAPAKRTFQDRWAELEKQGGAK